MNSKECAWGDIKVYVNGVLTAKAVEISYGRTKDKEYLYAGGNDPHGIQHGNRGYPGYIVLLKNAVDNINRAAMLAGGKDLLDVALTVVFDYKETITRPRQTDTLPDLEFSEETRNIAQNAKSMPVRLPFLAMDLIST